MPDDKPQRVICPTCGSRVRPEKLAHVPGAVLAIPKSDKDRVRNSVESLFVELTGLRPPADKKAAGRLWWAPLREMCELASWNEARAKDILYAAVKQLQAKSLTISDPNSILKTCRALAGSQARLPQRKQSAAEFLEGLG